MEDTVKNFSRSFLLSVLFCASGYVVPKEDQHEDVQEIKHPLISEKKIDNNISETRGA